VKVRHIVLPIHCCCGVIYTNDVVIDKIIEERSDICYISKIEKPTDLPNHVVEWLDQNFEDKEE
jgi:hypothetical protein